MSTEQAKAAQQQDLAETGQGGKGLSKYMHSAVPLQQILIGIWICHGHVVVSKSFYPYLRSKSGDKIISILHLYCRTSDLQCLLVLQTYALVF